MSHTDMSEADWFEMYQPMLNKYPVTEGERLPSEEDGCTTDLYCRETYGPQMVEVREMLLNDPHRVWSWIETPERLAIYNGFYEDAFMYWLTEKPWHLQYPAVAIRATSVYYNVCIECDNDFFDDEPITTELCDACTERLGG